VQVRTESGAFLHTFRAFWSDTIAAVGLVVLLAGTYHKTSRLWWTYDDAFLLHIAATHAQSQYYSSSQFWHEMPMRLFTPLLMSWYGLLNSRFGLDPSVFYRFQLAVLTFAVLAIFVTLRFWFSTTSSSLAAVLVIFGVPTCSIATQLMTVHYAMSVGFGALSVAAFALCLRRERYLLSLLSASLYFLAMLAKEIAIPLPGVMLLLPERSMRNRIRHVLPHLFAAGAYFVWRRMMIGTLLGGYGWSVRPADYPALVASFPSKILASFAADSTGMAMLLLALAMPAVALALSTRQAVVIWFGAFALATLPVLPVSHQMERRYALVAWIVAVILFVVGTQKLRAHERWHHLSLVLQVSMAIVVITAHRLEWSNEYRLASRMSDEGRFYVDAPSNAWLRQPAIPPGAMFHLQWMQENRYQHSGASWFYDDVFLCSHPASGVRVWQYVASARGVQDITSSVKAIARRSCSARTDVDLVADFDYEDGSLFWRLGPYVDGVYRFILGDGVQAFDMPRRDGFQLGAARGITLRVRYESPAGWTTYSPELAFDFTKQRHWHWQR
jgi:hypothetical protein